MHADEGATKNWEAQIEAVARILQSRFGDRNTFDVLEGGCGSASYLQFPANARITGIDISEMQLARNRLLHRRIVGDLQTYDLESGSFDAIVCWDVLEHLARPAAALERFAAALRPGGVLILAFPYRSSLKGWLTRALPHRAHVWVYRWLLRMRDAGKNDRGPFPTPMRPEMDRDVVLEGFIARNFTVLASYTYESLMMSGVRRKLHLHGLHWNATKALVRVVSRGRLDPESTDCILVLGKPATR